MRKYLLFLLLLIGSAVHAEELDIVTQAFPNEGAPYPLNAYSQILTGATPTVSTLGSATDLNASPGFSMCVFDVRPGFFSQVTVFWSPDNINFKASVSKGPGCYFFQKRARYVAFQSTGATGSTVNVQLATAQNLAVSSSASGSGIQAVSGNISLTAGTAGIGSLTLPANHSQITVTGITSAGQATFITVSAQTSLFFSTTDTANTYDFAIEDTSNTITAAYCYHLGGGATGYPAEFPLEGTDLASSFKWVIVKAATGVSPFNIKDLY